MSLIDIALDRSRTVILTLILLLATGWVGYNAIPKGSRPGCADPGPLCVDAS